MNTITVIFASLFLLLPIVLIIGLIQPRWIMRWSKKPARWKVAGWWILASFLCLMAIGFSGRFAESRKTPAEIIAGAEEYITPGHTHDRASHDKARCVAVIDGLRQIADKDPLYYRAQELLVGVARFYPGADKDKILKRAFSGLTDQKLLATLAQDINAARQIQKAAVDCLTDQQLLAVIVKSSETVNTLDVRLAALGKLTDRGLLADIVEVRATNQHDREVAWLALAKLDAPRLLEGFARQEASAELRLRAAWQLADKAALAGLAQNAPDELVRKVAAGKLAGTIPQGPVKGNLLELTNAGLVFATAAYGDISNLFPITVRLERMLPIPMEVVIPAGTCFIPGNPGAQGMVSTEDVRVVLNRDTTGAPVRVVSMSMLKDAPAKTDGFTIANLPGDTELARLMPVLTGKKVVDEKNRTADRLAKQAAVWIITDDAGYNALGILRWVPAYTGRRETGTRAIEEAETAEAMRLCAGAGIDIKTKSIWRDREKILAGLEPGELKTWLENLMKP